MRIRLVGLLCFLIFCIMTISLVSATLESIPSTETYNYNKTFLCDKTYSFINLHNFNGTINYTEDEFNYFKNNIVSELGVGISNEVLNSFIENFEGNCPDYGNVDGGMVITSSPEKKRNYLGLWIFVGIFILSLVITLIINRKYILALLLLNRIKKDKSKFS